MEWRDIPNYEGLYEVSNTGIIRVKKTGQIRKYDTEKNGYYRVTLCKNSKHKRESVHRIVASTFVPNPDGKREVNHIDGNKQNNESSNIEWVTSSENKQHSKQMGLRKTGQEHYGAKLTDEQIEYILKIIYPETKR